MTREQVAEIIKSDNATVVAFRTNRTFKNWVYNGALSDEADRLPGTNEPGRVFCLIVETNVENEPRAAQII